MVRVIQRYLLANLIDYLIKCNPRFATKWTGPKQCYMLWHLPTHVVLRKIRGALCDCSKDEILYAYNTGLFHAQPLIDSAVRVIRRRGWADDPAFQGIFAERCKYFFITIF